MGCETTLWMMAVVGCSAAVVCVALFCCCQWWSDSKDVVGNLLVIEASVLLARAKLVPGVMMVPGASSVAPLVWSVCTAVIAALDTPSDCEVCGKLCGVEQIGGVMVRR